MPKIVSRDLESKAEEYHCPLIGGLVKVMIKLRSTEHGFRVAYKKGGTKRSDYITLEAGGVYWEDGVQYFPHGLDVYLRCPSADNQKAEVLTWP